MREAGLRILAMLMGPQNPKYTKFHRIKLPAPKEFKGLKFGNFGLVAKEAGILKTEQLEAARMALWRGLKKKAKMWVFPKPCISYTKKPAETRMGKGQNLSLNGLNLWLGKGPVAGWATPIAKAHIIFEAAGCSREMFWEAARLANSKLPFRAVPVERE